MGAWRTGYERGQASVKLSNQASYVWGGGGGGA